MWQRFLAQEMRHICSERNQQRVHAWIDYDLLKAGLYTCRPIVLPVRDKTAKLPLVTAPMEIVSPSDDTEAMTDPHRTDRMDLHGSTTVRMVTR